MTNGDPAGTGGERATLIIGWMTAGAVLIAVAAVNVFTITHEQPRYGLALPVVWEGSSALAAILLIWLPYVTMRRLRGRPLWLTAIAHLPAAVVYSAAHVAGFIALRSLAYALGGARYEFGGIGQWVSYELPKDLMAYVMMVLTFWLIGRLRARAELAGPTMFDIRDGAKLVRTPTADILAVTSAGNYAEFVLADGRRPLMRASLASLEEALAPHGFVRTHRSWLVNAGRVSGLTPEGSGDYAVELGGMTVPLSRRFPDALARLRAG